VLYNTNLTIQISIKRKNIIKKKKRKEKKEKMYKSKASKRLDKIITRLEKFVKKESLSENALKELVKVRNTIYLELKHRDRERK
jgi:hypothetical protein